MVDADAADAAYRAAIGHERAARESRLRDPMGWLTLVGLHWLRPGAQRLGSGPDCDIVLRSEAGEIPRVAGTLDVDGGTVRVHPEGGGGLSVGGQPVPDGLELLDDEADNATVLQLASLRLVLIRRGGRSALRVRDVDAATLRAFNGLDYFDIDRRWRVMARLVRSAADETITVPDVLGDATAATTPGMVEFEAEGRVHRIHALEAEDGRLWLVFGDLTNRRETYAGGRFLVTGPLQPDDSVEVDFNLAYNPPCVFTPYATCPLPPEGNRLGLRIEAGERALVATARHGSA